MGYDENAVSGSMAWGFVELVRGAARFYGGKEVDFSLTASAEEQVVMEDLVCVCGGMADYTQGNKHEREMKTYTFDDLSQVWCFADEVVVWGNQKMWVAQSKKVMVKGKAEG